MIQLLRRVKPRKELRGRCFSLKGAFLSSEYGAVALVKQSLQALVFSGEMTDHPILLPGNREKNRGRCKTNFLEDMPMKCSYNVYEKSRATYYKKRWRSCPGK